MAASVDLCAAWAKIGEAPAATFSGILRDLAVGEWRLEGSVAALELAGAYTVADVDTIRVLDDSTVLFAGQVAPMSSGVGGLDRTVTAAGEQFALTGPDLWGLLAARVAYPSPATAPPWADAHDDRSGTASTVAAGYISDNLGVSALADRVVPGVSVVDGAVGSVGTWSARLQPLDQLVTRVCTDGGIICLPEIDLVGNVTFRLASRTDRSATLVLSDQGDLVGIEKVNTPAAATYVVAGGQGELTDRTFRDAGTAVGLARREVFYDVSSLASSTEVQQAATSKAASSAASLTVVAQLADYAAARFAYPTNYRIGDLVAVELDGVRYPVPVSSVNIVVSPERTVVRPVLGSAVTNLVVGLIRDVADLQSRFDTQIA